MIAHVTLATRDAARSCEFFIKTLGWKPVNRPGNAQMKSAWLRIPPAQELHLVQSPDFEPSPFEEENGRHVALEYPLEQFDELRERLVENGAELIEPRRETPFQRFFFKDPNGYVFEIVEAGHAPDV